MQKSFFFVMITKFKNTKKIFVNQLNRRLCLKFLKISEIIFLLSSKDLAELFVSYGETHSSRIFLNFVIFLHKALKDEIMAAFC